MNYGTTTFASETFADRTGLDVSPCRTAAYADFAFGSIPFAGDDCPPVILPPIPPEPLPPSGGRKKRRAILRFPAPKPEQRKEKKEEIQDQKEEPYDETDDEECIIAVINAFVTYAHARQMFR